MAVEVGLFDDLDSVEQDAGQALGRTARSSLCDRLDWFRLVTEYTPQGRALVVRACNGLCRTWLFLSVQGRSAEGLGNWYSVQCGPVVEGTQGRAAALGGLSRGLRRAGVSRVFLKRMEDAHSLARALRRRGWATSISRVNVSWRIDIGGVSFEEYWENRPSNLRRGVERRLRRYKIDSVIYDSFDAKAWEHYEAIYAASWKPTEGSSEFLRRLAEQEGAAGTLRLGIAYHEGQPVAAELWLVEKGVATIHKSAYREDVRHLGAGNILRLALFRHAIDVEKVETIDFGFGDQPYKADWMSYKTAFYALTAYDMLRPAGLAGIIHSLTSKLIRRGGTLVTAQSLNAIKARERLLHRLPHWRRRASSCSSTP